MAAFHKTSIHHGALQFYRASDFELKAFHWYDHEGTPGWDEELCRLVEDAGGKYVRTDNPERFGVEYVFDLNGQYIHVGSTDEDGPTAYLYAYSPNTYDTKANAKRPALGRAFSLQEIRRFRVGAFVAFPCRSCDWEITGI